MPRLVRRAASQPNASRAQNSTPKLVKRVASAAVPLLRKSLLSRANSSAHNLISFLAAPCGRPDCEGRVSLPGCVAGEPEEQARVVVAHYEVRRISPLVAMTQPGWLI